MGHFWHDKWSALSGPVSLFSLWDAPQEVAVFDESLAEQEGAVVGLQNRLEDPPDQVVHEVVPGVLEEEAQDRRHHLLQGFGFMVGESTGFRVYGLREIMRVYGLGCENTGFAPGGVRIQGLQGYLADEKHPPP